MKLDMVSLDNKLVPFIHAVYEQNREILHGTVITLDEWHDAFFGMECDPYEVNFIVMADDKPAAWLKINGMNDNEICISMLVIDDVHKRSGAGSFAVRFAEGFAKAHAKTGVRIRITKDNIPAVQCYLKQGYIAKEIIYAVGDGLYRDGYEFTKEIK